MNSSRSMRSTRLAARERVVVGQELDARLGLLAVADVAQHRHAVVLALKGITFPVISTAIRVRPVHDGPS